ncbi:MAG: hypothetical protein IV085_03315 [Thiobacillus sp.]|nr:hypothetical protein [Thiobacillus sp.]
MRPSHFFSELIKSYLDEVDDLVTDSDGKSVLQKRLNDKRREIDAILPMIEFSPEMVAVMFYGAFEFLSPETMLRIVQSEPDADDFPDWQDVETDLALKDWAKPLIGPTLKIAGGDTFLVLTAGLEFWRTRGALSSPAPTRAAEENAESDDHGHDEMDSDDYGSDELTEAGDDWLAEQGFDTLDRST